jgi:DNA topoisomerase-1
MHSLVIVESSAKSKTIQQYLNNSSALRKFAPFKVVASLGHITDLPAKTLGVCTDTWELEYVSIPTKLKVIKQIKEDIKNAKDVYIASDLDREGEAIAFHIQQTFKLKNPKRAIFNEITQKALEYAILNPTVINQSMVSAQEARRALDRVVGFKLSPLLWKRFASSSLSAGRVQSVLLRNIVERFNDYENHNAEIFWTIEGTFKIDNNDVEGVFVLKSKKDKVKFEEPSLSLQILEEIKETPKKDWKVLFELKESHKNPSAPYTTSALQQEVYETYKISSKTTMSLAQKLYESGYITYMRTDSVQISEDAHKMIKDYIENTYTSAYYSNRVFSSKQANTQEAHECIRPTKISLHPSELAEKDENMTPLHCKLYNIIWKKTVASQMISSTHADFIYRISTIRKEYEFYGKISFMQDLGYLKVWSPNQCLEIDKINKWKSVGNKNSAKAMTIKSKGNITKPEGLYNEASIIRWMEKEGIGRPSTYSTVIEKLFQKDYIIKGQNPIKIAKVEHYILDFTNDSEITSETEDIQFGGTETDRYVPTNLGTNVSVFLLESMNTIMNYKFTTNMEEQLDEISRSEKTKLEVLAPFYKTFEELLNIQNASIKEYALANPKQVKDKSELKPTNIIKEYPNVSAQLVKTKYGDALYNVNDKTFINVEPFLKWKKKDIEKLNDKDIKFLQRFPIKINDTSSIMYGRYGIYLMHNKKNIKLPKDIWSLVYNTETINPEDILAYTK